MQPCLCRVREGGGLMSTAEHTITGADWAGRLPLARARRTPAAVRARVFAAARCPVCGRLGKQKSVTGGIEISHAGGERCWWPQGSLVHERAEGAA